jgi:hypothetical protein
MYTGFYANSCSFLWCNFWNIFSFNIIYDPQALISIDPVRARDDSVIVKNIPYYKAKKALEAEVTRLDPPPRPPNWGVRILYFHFMYAISCFWTFVYISILSWISILKNEK